MTQAVVTSNQPSIQNIEPYEYPQKYMLSPQDINRLFQPNQFPKFDIFELKKEEALNKHPIVSFFISKIQNWNKILSSGSHTMNMRTEYLATEFLYSSIKRISMMKENQMQGQLKILYSWYLNQAHKKGQPIPSMPNKKSQEDQTYDVAKELSPNRTLLIDEYRRKHFDIRFSKKASEMQKQQFKAMNQTFNAQAQKKVESHFLTSPPKFTLQTNKKRDNFMFPNAIDKVYHKEQKSFNKNTKVFLNRVCSDEKIRQDQVRRYRQMLQLKQSQQKWKHEKSRLMQEIGKNFYEGDFKTSARYIKSSQEKRTSASVQIQKIKQYRVQTSWKPNPIKISGEKENQMPQLTQVNNLGLLKNPQQSKLKKKKKKDSKKKK